MKKTFIITFALFISMMAMAQQVVKHTVVAGETIASIAVKYGVSEADIKDANPETKQYFYTGMELVIPNKSKAATETVTESNTHVTAPANSYKETSYNYSQTNVKESPEKEERAGKVGVASEAIWGYVIPNLGEGLEAGFSMAFSVAMGAKFYPTNNLYIEGLAGYKFMLENFRVKNYSKDWNSSTIHNITIPLHVGVSIPSPSRVSIGLFAGSRIDIPVSAKNEYKNEKGDLDVPVHALIEAGLDIKFGGDVAMRLLYDYSPSKTMKYSLVSIGVVAAF